MKEMKRTNGGKRKKGGEEVQKKWRHIKEGVDDESDLRGHRKLAAEMIQIWLLSFLNFTPYFFFFTHVKSHVTTLSPLAAHADKDDEDGDHKGGCCCDGSQEQQVLVGRVVGIFLVDVIHDTHSLSLTHSLPLELKLCHTDRLLRKTCRDKGGGKEKDTTYE